MSPVSRGRKNKSSKKRDNRSPSIFHDADFDDFPELLRFQPDPARPAWFDTSINAILTAGAGSLVTAQSPRQLEDATATLIGEHLHRALQDEENGLFFSRWADSLADAAAQRVREHDADWQGAWWLLHGLMSVGTPALAQRAADAVLTLRKQVRQRPGAGDQPEWLRDMRKVSATGQVWRMQDVYGGRLAVIAGFRYPKPAKEFYFLFDFDVCGFIDLVGAGTYDNVEQAAAAWRGHAGAPAEGADPQPISSGSEVEVLSHWDSGDMSLMGTESRAAMDNRFRADRRAGDLASALRRQRMPLPPPHSLFDRDVDPFIDGFTEWYTARHDAKPDEDAVFALAEEWIEGTLTGTEHVASPHRVQHVLALMNDDWIPDDPITVTARELLPDWVRWNGEQSGLPAPLAEAAVAVGDGRPRAATPCPGAH